MLTQRHIDADDVSYVLSIIDDLKNSSDEDGKRLYVAINNSLLRAQKVHEQSNCIEKYSENTSHAE